MLDTPDRPIDPPESDIEPITIPEDGIEIIGALPNRDADELVGEFIHDNYKGNRSYIGHMNKCVQDGDLLAVGHAFADMVRAAGESPWAEQAYVDHHDEPASNDGMFGEQRIPVLLREQAE